VPLPYGIDGWLRLALLAGSLGLGATAGAQPATVAGERSSATAARVEAGGPRWASLTGPQRQILAPLERDWALIDAPRKAKWLEVAARFPAMPAAEQQRVQERMAEWARMTPTQRGRARLSFQESKQFSPEEKQARWEAYQALPDDQRKALAARGKPQDERPKSSTAGRTALDAATPSRATASAPQTKPIAPTVVQARPGATTRLMNTPAEPPAHHQPGQPKIAAKPGQVDRSTLLPRSGPQAAASSARQP